MTQEQLDKLSVRLTQAGTPTTRKFGGIGLSLALTKAPSTMLDGHVAVERHPGKPQHHHAEAASRVQGWYAGGPNETGRPPAASADHVREPSTGMKDLPRPWRGGALRLVLAAVSIAMARHAVELGIVSANAIAAVVEDGDEDPVPVPDRDPSPDAVRAGRRSTT